MEGVMSTNDVTGDSIVSKLGSAESSQKYRDNYDRIFGGRRGVPGGNIGGNDVEKGVNEPQEVLTGEKPR